MRNYLWGSTLILFIVLASCTKSGVVKPPEVGNPVLAQTQLNVSYGKDNKQKMDVYLPANRSVETTKVIFMIHGGSWAEGDKNDTLHAPFVDTLKNRFPDWAIFNLNYRLSNYGLKNNFPTQENDINSAINFVFNNRANYFISDKWVYVGASAGGQLAMLQAYKNNSLIKPKAVVNFFGPSDMERMYNDETDFWIKSGLKTLLNGLAVESSPINYINAQTPPTITLQGISDNTVPVIQQQKLHEKLTSFNVAEKLIIYKDEGHGFTMPTYSKSFDSVTAFLNVYMK